MMAVYTVSLNLLEKLDETEMEYFGSILYCFTNKENLAKLAVDKNRIILSRYRDIQNNASFIKVWLDLLSYIDSKIEIIDIDLTFTDNPEELCLALCGKTNGAKKLIVHSFSSFEREINENDCIEYDGSQIIVLDKDKARKELNETNIINIINSQIAGRDIIGSNNTNQ